MLKKLRLIFLLAAAAASGCQSLSDWVSNSGLFKQKPAPTPFSESAAAWDGTWAEQKTQ